MQDDDDDGGVNLDLNLVKNMLAERIEAVCRPGSQAARQAQTWSPGRVCGGGHAELSDPSTALSLLYVQWRRLSRLAYADYAGASHASVLLCTHADSTAPRRAHMRSRSVAGHLSLPWSVGPVPFERAGSSFSIHVQSWRDVHSEQFQFQCTCPRSDILRGAARATRPCIELTGIARHSSAAAAAAGRWLKCGRALKR